MSAYYYECKECGSFGQLITESARAKRHTPDCCGRPMKQMRRFDPERLEIKCRPRAFYDWPAEIQRLYSAVIVAVLTEDTEARESEFKELYRHIKQHENRKLADGACMAFWELSVRLDPNILKGLAAQLFGVHGQAVIDLTTKFLSFAPNEKARRIIGKHLELFVSAFSPRNRA